MGGGCTLNHKPPHNERVANKALWHGINPYQSVARNTAQIDEPSELRTVYERKVLRYSQASQTTALSIGELGVQDPRCRVTQY
jgi:hypothetical protein